MPRKPDYSNVLARTLRDLEHDIAQKPQHEKHSRLLWYAVRAVARLAPPDEATATKLEVLGSRLGKPYGLTDAIRSVLFIAAQPLEPGEIQELLEATGFDLRRYTFSMGAIHKTLKYLVERSEVRRASLPDGSKLYRWRCVDPRATETWVRELRSEANRILAQSPVLRRTRPFSRYNPPVLSAADSNVISSFLDYLKVEKGRAQLTIAAYGSDAAQFAGFLAQRDLSLANAHPEDVRGFLAGLARNGADARTVARKFSALHHLYKYLSDRGVIKGNPIRGVDTPKWWMQLPKALAQVDLRAVVGKPRSDDRALATAIEARDRAILEMFCSTALKVSEILRVEIEDVHLGSGYLFVRGAAHRQRFVPLGALAQDALAEYMATGRSVLERESSPVLFLGRGGRKLSRQRVWQVVCAASERAGSHATPAMLRATSAAQMIEDGADLSMVQTILGHAHSKTTQIYRYVALERVRKVYEQTHPRAKAGAPRRTRYGKDSR